MRPSDLIQLIWLASPALPVGGFSYSEGLEAAVDQGLVTTESGAQHWLVDQLHLSLARSDLPVLCLAISAWRNADGDGLQRLNAFLTESRESAELRLQSQQMGTSFTQWHTAQGQTAAANDSNRQTTASPVMQSTAYPVAFAKACAETTASVAECAYAFAFGWAENMVAAAVRAVPLGQTSGQRVLKSLAAEIEIAVSHALKLRLEDLQSFTPGLALLSCQHEHQYSRLFRS